MILDGSCRRAVDGHEPIKLQEGDFALSLSAYGFRMSSREPPTSEDVDTVPVALLHGEFSLGDQSGPPEVPLLVGYCLSGSPDAALLVGLLAQLMQVRGESRLATIVQLVGEKSGEMRPARDVILARLLEVLLIETLRSRWRSLRKHVQRRIHPPCRTAANPVCARAEEIVTPLAR